MLERWQPDEAAVEETFVNKNPASTLKLGMARGVVLLVPAKAGLPVAEYPANLVKKSVVGAGHAEKEQVQVMVRMLLPGVAISRRTPPTRWPWRSATRIMRRPGGVVAAAAERAMIAKLSGLLDSVGTDHCIVDCGGVGYLVFCSARTLAPRRRCRYRRVAPHRDAGARGRHPPLRLHRSAERDWFRLLTTVQGVGARVALALLSVLAPDKLGQAIAAQDRAALARADGVGPKLANRLISELKDKVGDLYMGGGAGRRRSGGRRASGGRRRHQRRGLRSGQSGLSARRGVHRRRGRRPKAGPDAEVEQLIMMGLKELSA